MSPEVMVKVGVIGFAVGLALVLFALPALVGAWRLVDDTRRDVQALTDPDVMAVARDTGVGREYRP